jgi:ferredoxin-NADP reductase/ferredoxin
MTVGFRIFRVANKVVESTLITSFYFEATDGAPLDPVAPGQYLNIMVPAKSGPIAKTYSVSSDPSETGHYRITVKREAGHDDAPDGVGSCWLHDDVHVGDTVELAAPRGSFTLDEASERPVLLLSGGVGLTPMVSMLHRLRQGSRPVHFLHACENGEVHAMRDEVQACANDQIKTSFVYRAPTDADRAAQLFDAEGMIDKSFMQANVPIGNYEAYICGPTPFMVAMYNLLLDLGVPKAQISYEFFGKAASLEALAEEAKSPQTSNVASSAPAIIQAIPFLTDPDAWAEASGEEPKVESTVPVKQEGSVTFQASDITAQWDGQVESLLELAENAGLDPEFSCREGICNMCKCTLVSGEVEYFEEPLIDPAAGKVLLCCSRPNGPVVLDI